MAAPTYRASTSVQEFSGSGTTVSDKPAGTVEGDGLVAWFFAENGFYDTTGDLTPPAGWTTVAEVLAGNAPICGLYKKIAGASEGTTYTWSNNDGSDRSLVIVCITNGTFDATWFDGAWTSGTDYSIAFDGSAGTAVAAPTITPAVVESLGLASYAAIVVNSWTAPSTWTERLDASNSFMGSHLASKEIGASATGTISATADDSVAANDGFGSLVAIRPAAGGEPETWAGSTGVLTLGGTSGAFDAGLTTWAGSTGALALAGMSGAFDAGLTVWAGSTGTLALTGASGTFTSVVAWAGSTGSLALGATSGSFVAGAATWVGTTGALTLAATSGDFTSSAAWPGSVGALALAATSGSFDPGLTAWAGTAGTLALTGTSGVFASGAVWAGSPGALVLGATSGVWAAGPITWSGSPGALALTAATGAWAPGAGVWDGTVGTLLLTAISGVWDEFTDLELPATSTGNISAASSTGTITRAASAGGFVAATSTGEHVAATSSGSVSNG